MALEKEIILLEIQIKNEKALLELQKKLVGFQKEMATALNSNDKASVKELRNKIAGTQLEIKNQRLLAKESTSTLSNQIKQQKIIEGQQQRLQTNTLKWGMSFLFAGMWIKGVLDGVAKSSFTSFNKINADTELANNATGRLAGTLEEVRYIVGESLNAVLEALEPYLMNIVEWFIKLTDEHQKLVGVALILGIIGSNIAYIAGQIGLLSIGIGVLSDSKAWATISAKAIMIGATLAGWVTAIWDAIKALGLFVWKSIITNAGLVWATLKGWGTAILSAVKALGAWIVKSFLAIAPLLAVVAIIGVIIGLLTGQEPVVKFVKNLVIGISKVIAFIMYAFEQIGKSIAEIFTAVWDFIADYFMYALKGAINGIINAFEWMINGVIKGLNKILSKFGLGKINLVTFEGLENEKPEGVKERLSDIGSFFKTEVFQGERLQEYMSAAKHVGDMFEDGLKMITDAIGTTKEGEGWNNTLKDLFGKQEQGVDTFTQGVDKQIEAIDKQKESTDKFANSVDKLTASTNSTLSSGFNFTLPSGSN